MGPVDEAKQMFTLDCYLRQVKKITDEIYFFLFLSWSLFYNITSVLDGLAAKLQQQTHHWADS